MLICLSITQILGHIYLVMDADLYTIHEEMLTLVELHRTQKKCSVKSNKIKRQSNLNFLLQLKTKYLRTRWEEDIIHKLILE